MKYVVIGGSGFVGKHLISHLLDKIQDVSVISIDIVESYFSEKPAFVFHDVRKKDFDFKSFYSKFGKIDVIINLAALCKIPGFPHAAYFQTNIAAAEFSCQLADYCKCTRIIFTSTMSVYESTESLKTEESIPAPDNAYGCSKLVAEHILLKWAEKNEKYKVIILRPGVIFGKGDNANMTRLVLSLKKGFFLYPGRKDTLKACVYVKDVVKTILHFLKEQPTETKNITLNVVYRNPPTIEEIIRVIKQVYGIKYTPIVVPSFALLFIASVIKMLFPSRFIGIHPDRVRKLMVSTNISGKALYQIGVNFDYNLINAFKDWKKDGF